MITKHSPAHIVARYLIAEAAATDPDDDDAWPVFIGHMPDSDAVPDNCIAVYDTEGLRDGRLMRTGAVVVHPGLQVRIRSRSHTTGWSKAIEVWELLQLVNRTEVWVPEDVGNRAYTIQNLSQDGPPLALGVEPGTKRRNLFTLNYLATLNEEGLMLTGLVETVAHDVDASLAAAALENYFHTNSGAGTDPIRLELPPAADGLSGWFVQIDPGDFEVAPPAGETLSWSGGTLSAGQALIMQNPVSAMFIFSDGVNGWTVLVEKGTIVEES